MKLSPPLRAKTPTPTRRPFLWSLPAQLFNSAGSFLPSLYVARFIEFDQLAVFATVYSMLLVLVSVQTSWVGDSCVVLGADEDDLRPAAQLTQAVLMLAAVVISVLVGTTLGLKLLPALLLAMAAAAWLAQEYGRRWLMAENRFSHLAVNDGVYLAVESIALAVALGTSSRSLGAVFVAMAMGSGSAFVAATVQSPHVRPVLGHVKRSVLRRFTAFGVTRVGQASAGALAAFIIKLYILHATSARQASSLEAARILISPLFTLMTAICLPLLTLFRTHRNETNIRQLSRRTATLAIGMVSLYGLALAVGGKTVRNLVLGQDADSSLTTEISWLTHALMVGLTASVFALRSVDGNHRTVMWYKILSAILAVGLTPLLLRLFGVAFTPVAQTVALLVAALPLYRIRPRVHGSCA